jgi:hypothetical protein
LVPGVRPHQSQRELMDLAQQLLEATMFLDP